MKRSEINAYQQDAVKFLQTHKFHIPPWAFWTADEWKQKGIECDEIRKCKLGWDITDFGSGDFNSTGLFLFTIRNGIAQSKKYHKVYAEKIMIVRENQLTPAHFHWKKTEDIINRGGGILRLQLWKAAKDESFSDKSFSVQVDGISRILKPGAFVKLNPGESITLEPYIYHNFIAERSKTLIGEVSTVNDDKNDNRFYHPVGRFPKIEEDVQALYPLCTEYP